MNLSKRANDGLRAAAALGAAAVLVALGGCATARSPSAADPWEPMNRGLYAVHEAVDKVVMKPAVTVYRAVIPTPARTGVANFFNNIDDVFSVVYDVMQAKPQKAGDDLGRVMINTFFGLGGLIDIGSSAGIERGNEDLGQTLAVWGMSSGPYIFIPLLGPSTVRDSSDYVARFFLGPTSFISDVPTRNTVYTLGAIDLRSKADDALSVVDAAALDRYAFIRNAYLQRRRYLIFDGKVPPDPEDKP